MCDTDIRAIGDIAQFMLLSSTRYAFLISANEIIFLKFDMTEKVEYNTHDNRDPVDLFIEPWLSYSAPITFTDLLDEKKNTVSAKLALLYLLHCSTQEGWQMSPETGTRLNYAAKMQAGERWVPTLSWLGGNGKRKEEGNYDDLKFNLFG